MADYVLDLTQFHFTHTRGDLTIYGTWYGKQLQQCLVIVPTFRVEKCVPLIIDVDDAYKWNTDDWRSEPVINRLYINSFLDQNMMDPGNTFTAMKVMTLIHDHLGDLLHIPPKPTTAVVVADAIRKDHDTGREHHTEVIEHV